MNVSDEDTFADLLKSWSDETRDQHLAQANSRFPGPDYYDVLKWIHQIVRPNTYIEIGVRHGESLSLALSETQCVGIDPTPCITLPLPPTTRLFRMTSDDFFMSNVAERCLAGRGHDLAFIDGLHLFEQVLRDFIHLERHAAPGSMIMLHDCIPLDDLTSSRVRTTQFYSGDAWKAVAALSSYRADLRIAMVRTSPTGLCLVTNLNASNNVLAGRFAEVVAAFREQRWSEYLGTTEYLSRTIDNQRSAVEAYFNKLQSGTRS